MVIPPRDRKGERERSDRASDPPRRAELEEAYAEHLARIEGGEAADIDALLLRFPDCAEELRALDRGCMALREELLGMRGPLRPIERAGRAGLRLGGFRLVRLLGRGGMGEVWEAEEPALSRRVALKLLLPERLNERGIRFFEREARAAGRVRHPGIVTVHAAGRSEGIYWLSQELVEGGRSLASELAELRASGAKPAGYHRRIATLFRDVSRALAAAHAEGVLHRDLKPGNVLVDPEGRPRVVDFGLARITDEASLSDSGDVVGTYSYMSPEQVSARRGEIGPWSDVFSLGVMLYEALALERPFGADTTHALATRILFHEPADPDRVRPDVPRELAVICKKSIEKTPSKRFASMEELACELERFLEHRPILTRPPNALGRAERWVRRHPALGAAIALIAVASFLIARLASDAWDARTDLRLAELEVHLAHAQIASEAGDLEAVRREVSKAQSLAPADPMGQLVLAWACARSGRIGEAESALRSALQNGFDPDADTDGSALSICTRGLYRLYLGGPGQLEAAEADLVTARAQDPSLEAADYALYHARLARGDVAGAHLALVALAGELPPSRPMAAMVSALRLELENDPRGAIAELESLAAESSANGGGLRVDRVLGRLRLRAGDVSSAVDTLRAAVREAPRDEASWCNLGLALYLSAESAPDDRARAGLDEARECAERALEIDPQHRPSLALLASLALEDYESRCAASEAAPDDSELLARVEALRVRAPEHPALRQIESQLSALRADRAVRAGSFGEGLNGFRDALDQDHENLRARVRLAQELYFRGELESSLAELEEALAVWNRSQTEGGAMSPTDPWIPRHLSRAWFQALMVWRFGVASQLQEIDVARAAREAVERELEAGRTPPPEELLTYAEFLATCGIEALRDCARALELIDQHGLRARFAGRDDGAETLENVDRACD